MKNNKGAGFGVFLLTVGIIWVLVSRGIITWSIVNALMVLWPLILVIVGINIIFRNNEIIKALAWFAFLAVVISYGYFYVDKAGEAGGEILSARSVTIEKRADTQKGNLRIALGGTRLNLNSDISDSARLLEAKIQDQGIVYTPPSKSGDTITFSKKSYNLLDFNSNLGNRYNIFHLSNEVPWNIEVDTGAVDARLNLADLAVEELSLDMGAANAIITLGDKYSNPKIDINAGASNIEINVPMEAGVRIDMDGALNSTNLDGSHWEKRNGTYYSRSYEDSDVQINLEVDMGVGNFKVNFR